MALASKTAKIALDTNMLLAIQKFKVDFFQQAKELEGRVKFIVPIQVMQELDELAKGNKTIEKASGLAKKLMRLHGVKTRKMVARNADQALLKLARKGFIVATNDKELKKEIKKFSGSIMFLRKRKLIEKE